MGLGIGSDRSDSVLLGFRGKRTPAHPVRARTTRAHDQGLGFHSSFGLQESANISPDIHESIEAWCICTTPCCLNTAVYLAFTAKPAATIPSAPFRPSQGHPGKTRSHPKRPTQCISSCLITPEFRPCDHPVSFPCHPPYSPNFPASSRHRRPPSASPAHRATFGPARRSGVAWHPLPPAPCQPPS